MGGDAGTVAFVASWPFVARHAEVEQFEALLRDSVNEGAVHAFVVHGAAGVGKTRLAEECLAQAAARDHATGRATASAAAAAIPLGALAHLLPVATAADATDLFDKASTAMRAQAGSKRYVLMVDDLHLLDAASVTLVQQLLAVGVVLLIGTIRSPDATPDITRMWSGDRITRVDMGLLGRQSVDTLLHLALNGPVAAETSARLWTATQGNVLFLRELVLGALTSGALTDTGDGWRLEGPLAHSSRLRELVGERIEGVAAEGRAILDRLALCQPIGVESLEATAPVGTLDALEALGLIRLDADGRRQQVTLSHPLHGEVLRELIAGLRRRSILLEEAARVDAHGGRRREDALRIATWKLSVGVTVDEDLLMRAAHVARFGHDFAQVVTFARHAQAARPSSRGGLLLGEALYELGSFEEAETVLADAQERADSDEDRLLTALAREKNLFWGLGRNDDAFAVTRAARAALSTADSSVDDARDQLLASEASLLLFSGHPVDSLELLGDLGRELGTRAHVLWAIPAAPALSFTGRTEEALSLARTAFEEHLALEEQVALAHPGTHVVAQAVALSDGGRLEEARELAEFGYEIGTTQRIPIARIWFGSTLGRVSLLMGRPATATRWSTDAARSARETGFEGPGRLALAGVAVARAWLGDAEGAASAVTELETLRPLGFLEPEISLGRAWALVATGQLAQARSALIDGAALAAETGHRISESWLLHDLARLGDLSGADRLLTLAGECDSAMVAARRDHVQAMVDDDAAGLLACASTFEGMNALLYAAEASSAAADALRRAGEQRGATSAAARAHELATNCEGARTRALLTVDSIVPLTGREREIALLAADGVQSRDIADRLFLSVRTVNNHLQRIYSKLGVSGRHELQDALDRTGGTP